MIPYQIRSTQLINLVRDIQNGNLIPNAYFQRNLVWREIHKKDLIKTILLGYPFPLIFISKGKIDVERMTTTSCIVDGQQRCNAITTFILGEFNVDGRYFHDFSDEEKSTFFKYEIPVIELDILNTDDKVLDIFQRINRTSNSLTTIEKQASEYGSTYFMLVCEFLSNQLSFSQDENNDTEDFRLAPNMPDDFKTWAESTSVSHYQMLINDNRIFTDREISRKVNLQYTLNLVSTFLGGLYTRNDKVDEYLDLYIEDFPLKDKVCKYFNKTALLFNSLNLPHNSMWFNKANFFSLFYELSKHQDSDIDPAELTILLNNFEPDDAYKIAAKEGVNNNKERTHRSITISNLLNALKVN